MRILKWAAGIAGAVCLVLLLLSGAIIILTFSLSFYERQNEKNGAYALVDMEKPELMRVTRHMLDYMRGKQAELNITATVGGERRLFFGETEILHMKDVKDLFTVCFAVRNISAVLLAASVIFLLVTGSALFLLKCLRASGIAALALIALLAIAAAVNFERAFELFHEIFFDNDLWILNPKTDLLIRILPESFFADIAALIGAIFVSSTAAVTVAACLLIRIVKRNAVDNINCG